jgi:hypothetical protein
MDQKEIERLARRFHDVYEQLAPQFGSKEQNKSAVAWSDLPSEKCRLMIVTVGVVMAELDTQRVDAQQIEFDRNHWQRKVGTLLALIDAHVRSQKKNGFDCQPLADDARKAVNTNWYTNSQGDPIADVAKMTVEKTIATALEAGIVSKPTNGAG